MGYQAAPDGSLGPPCGLYQFWSHTEGTTAAWVQMVALAHLWLPTHPRPLPIDSIRDITGSEKIIQKTSSIQIAGIEIAIIYDSYITTLYLYNIYTYLCIVPQGRTEHSILQIRISRTTKYASFPRPGHIYACTYVCICVHLYVL